MIFIYDELHGIKNIKNIKNVTERTEVRRILAMDFEVLPKGVFDANSTDIFGENDLRVWYDSQDIVTELEVYHPWAEFVFHDMQVLGSKVLQLETHIIKLGPAFSLKRDGVCLILEAQAVKFFVPDIAQLGNDAIIKSVAVVVKGKCGS